ncbi:MAG: antitoxin VapB family protein [archaeon]|nr:antitoxin VapB family protein [archaeon]
MNKAEKMIRVNGETYKMLNEFVGELRAEEKRPVSMNEALERLLGKNKKRDIMEFAGTWKGDEKELREIKHKIKEVGKRWKPKQF